MARWLLVVVAWLALVQAGVADVPPGPAPDLPLPRIEPLFSEPSDLLAFKLKVDALVDPQMFAGSVSAQIEELSSSLLPMAAGERNSHERLKVLRRFLYESGPWNGKRPFTYDLANPRGNDPRDKLLLSYIASRKGNCVTMPLLLAILGQRLGLKMRLALAPFHVFIKMTDEQGREWNIEATSGGGYTRELWYRQQLPMTDAAVAKGTYLRALSDEEAKAVIASLLVEKAMADHQPEQAAILAGGLLQHYPGFANALIYRGSASAMILRQRLLPLFPDPHGMPPEIRAYADLLLEQNRRDFAAAEALGWSERDGIKP